MPDRTEGIRIDQTPEQGVENIVGAQDSSKNPYERILVRNVVGKQFRDNKRLDNST